jgi:phospholipid/cholesterol/gamma-HCH transport system permease protein
MATVTQIATPTPSGESAGAVSVVTNVVATVGSFTLRGFSSVGASARFAIDTLIALRDGTTWLPQALGQMWILGVASLPIALFIATFTGIVLALLASYSFTGAVPLYFVGTLVEKTITLELAPVLTGLALAGRVGANIAAELGTMRVTEQIDALETLGYDPVPYLVVPRVFAGVVMFPVVVAASMLVGVGAGWAASVTLLHLSTPEFVKGVRLFFQPFDVRYGLVKSASFGFAVSLIGCAQGLRTEGGAVGVGRTATSAVVYSAVLILVLDAFWAVTWLLGRDAAQ